MLGLPRPGSPWRPFIVAGLVATSFLGCDSGGDGDDGDGGGATQGSTADATSGEGGAQGTGGGPAEAWQAIQGDWRMPAGTEGYRCVRRTFDEDVLIQALEPIAPTGTHHVLVGIEDAGASTPPDGDAPCTAADVGSRLIYGSGLGTEGVEMPPGTAIAIPAGTQIVINLHIFNVLSTELEGSSGFRFLPAAPEADPTPLEALLAGTDSFALAPMSTTTEAGTCTLDHDGVIVGLMPHMHELGTHLTATLRRKGGAEQLLHDADYSFDLQVYEIFDPPIDVQRGDRIDVACTWNNTTDEEVVFGTSSRSEMCFAVVLRDAGSDDFTCVQ